MARDNERPARDNDSAGRRGADRNESGRPYNDRGEKKIFNRRDKGEGREGGERRSFGNDRGENRGDRKPYEERRSFGGDRDRREGGERRSFGGDRREGGERRSFGGDRERKPYGERREGGERRSFGGDRERKSYGDRNEGGERRFGTDRREGGERKSFNRREEGERRSFDGNREERGERRSFGNDRREGGERKSFGGERREERGEKRSFGGDRERKPFGDRREGGERRSFGGDRDRNEGRERRSFDGERQEQRSFGDRREGGERRSFGGDRERKPYGDRRESGERKSFDRKDKFSEKGGERRSRGSEHGPEQEPETPNYNLSRYKDSTRIKKTNRKGEDEDGTIRLNRYIANAGVCSRREADELILAGEIKVNGEVVTEMGFKVQPSDTVMYGKKVLSREKMVYVLLNKPKDFITTTEDPEGRKTVMSLVEKASKERIFPVGRLDRNTTGLLLFTNDGELAQKLTHPSNEIKKIYQVELDKPITKDDFQKVAEGVELEDGKAMVDDVAMLGDSKKFLGLEIHIGRNRIVRRIFEHLGYEVVTLDRVQYAGLTKKDVPRGEWRYLTEKEVIRLKYFM